MNEALLITVLYEGESIELETYVGAYRNLMELIADRVDIDSFGECGGIGRCAACIGQLIHSEFKLSHSDRNEYTTLRKLGILEDNIRLTCQLPIDIAINNLTVRLLTI